MDVQQKEYQFSVEVVDVPIPEQGMDYAGTNRLSVSSLKDPSIHSLLTYSTG